MKKTLITLLSLLALTACEPQPQKTEVKLKATGDYAKCNDMVPFGFPQFTVQKERMVFSCHDNYALAYDLDDRIAYWTAEHLYGSTLIKHEKEEPRQDRVRADVNLPENFGSMAEAEFENALSQGFAYRPFANTSNWLGDQRAMSKTYYFTNLFPYPRDRQNVQRELQYEEYLNKLEKENEKRIKEGEKPLEAKTYTSPPDSASLLWRNMENHIRSLIKKYGEGYIISGSVFHKSSKHPYGYLGKFGVEQKQFTLTDVYKAGLKGDVDKLKNQEKGFGLTTPTHIFKVIYFPKQDRTIVYVVPNGSITDLNPESYRQNLNTLEKITHLNFFPLRK